MRTNGRALPSLKGAATRARNGTILGRHVCIYDLLVIPILPLPVPVYWCTRTETRLYRRLLFYGVVMSICL